MLYAAQALATAIPVVLGLLVARRGQARIGWLLVAHGLSVGVLLGGSGLHAAGGPALVLDQLLAGGWIFLFLWLVLIAYLLPDGRPLTTRWRRWIQVGLAGVALFLVGAAGDQDAFRADHGGVNPPLTWLPPALSGGLGVLGLVLVVLFFFGSAFAVRARMRASTGPVRLQLMWLVWGGLAVPLGLLVVWAEYAALGGGGLLTDVTLTAMSVVLPVTVAIAVLRHQLFGIEVVLSRTLTYGAMASGVVAVYALVLLVAERLGGDRTAGGLIAVVIVAVAAHPAYLWLRRRAERWVYGYRSQPQQAMRLLADRAEAADPESLGAAVTTAVAEALRVDRVWVATGTDQLDLSGQVLRSPLVHRGEHLGDLAVEVPAGRRLSAADLALLGDLARYAAVLVRHDRQETRLRESRRRIVAAREEERRRLRQDLHDGVGPSLAAVVLTLNAAQSRADDAERAALVAEARDEVRHAIAEVRRVVDDLRPPAIDEVGLLGAIRQRAASLSVDFPIEVSGPEPVPALPAAVEVAAFRIASEAMANVAHHARASMCRIEIRVSDVFELVVLDDGRGATGRAGHGVGWTSMRERAAELGGSCTIANRDGGGLVVRALLPIEEQAAPPADVEALA